jgi:Condensation domain
VAFNLRGLSVNQLAATRAFRDGGAYSPMPLGIRIKFRNAIPLCRIREAMMKLIQQQEVLRYRLLRGTKQAQLVSPDWLPHTETLPCGPDGGVDEAALQAWAEVGAPAPGPFLKWAHFGDPVQILCVLLDHVVADGWSLQVVAAVLLANLGLAESPDFLRERSTFQRRVEEERRDLSGPKAQEIFSQWREYLDGESPLPVRSFPSIEVESAHWLGQQGPRYRSVAVPPATVAAINDAARSRSVTPFILSSAVVAGAMARDLNVERPAFVTAAANRVSEDQFGVVGWFASTWPLLFGNVTYTSVEERVTRGLELMLRLYEMPMVPLSSLLKEFAPKYFNSPTRIDFLSLQVRPIPSQYTASEFEIKSIPDGTRQAPQGGIYLLLELPQREATGRLEVLVDSARFDLERVCDWSADWLAEAASLAAGGR